MDSWVLFTGRKVESGERPPKPKRGSATGSMAEWGKRELFRMTHRLVLHNAAITARAQAIIAALPQEPVHEVVIREHKSKRSLEQNDKMWAMLTDISRQVDWYGQKLSPEEWKDVLTAGLKQQKVVPGIDGGFVVIGARTSKMSIKEMSEVIELAGFFGDQQQVKWGGE